MNKEEEYTNLVFQTSDLRHDERFSAFRKLLQGKGFHLDRIATFALDGSATEAYLRIVSSDGYIYHITFGRVSSEAGYSKILEIEKYEPEDEEDEFLISNVLLEEKRQKLYKDCLKLKEKNHNLKAD